MRNVVSALIALLGLGLLAACATTSTPWPTTVVSVDAMRPLVPMRTRVEYRRREGPPSGTVVLRMLVDESGQVVRSVVLQSSGHAGLDEAALHAAREARFAPHRVNGVATAVTVLTPMHFGQPTPPAP